MQHRFAFSRTLLVGLALLAALALNGTVFAHAQLVAVEPPAGAQLATPPTEVRAVFNEPLAALSSLQLLDAQGQAVGAQGAPSADEPEVLVLTPPELAPGVYTAVWSIIGSDGHVVKGNFAFTVLGPTSSTTAPVPSEEATSVGSTAEQLTGHAPPSPLAIALRGVMLVGVAAAVGGWVFFVALLLPAVTAQGGAPSPDVVRRWRRWTSAFLLLVMVASAAMLLIYTAEIAGGFDLTLVPVVVQFTRYGLLLVARFLLAGALLMLVAPWSSATPSSGWRGLSEVLPIGGLLLLTFSLSGHAAAQEALLWPVVADWLHLSATALWLGGLALFAALLPAQLRSLPEEARPPLLGRLFTRFSTLALVCVGVLTATGIYAARREILAPAALVETAYGQALLAKLVIFGGLLIFGAYHLLVARPRLEAWATRTAGAALAGQWQRRVSNTLRAETSLALLAVLVAGALTSLPPPAVLLAPHDPDSTLRPVEADTPRTYRRINEGITVEDLSVWIDVDPTRLGANTFTLTITGQQGQALETIQLVRLSLERPDLDIGVTEVEAVRESATEFKAANTHLNLLGDWQVRVLVRRSDADDVEATFMVPVAE